MVKRKKKSRKGERRPWQVVWKSGHTEIVMGSYTTRKRALEKRKELIEHDKRYGESRNFIIRKKLYSRHAYYSY